MYEYIFLNVKIYSKVKPSSFNSTDDKARTHFFFLTNSRYITNIMCKNLKIPYLGSSYKHRIITIYD